MDEEAKTKKQIKDDLFERVYQEIRNLTLAEAFLAVQDGITISQNEFARRVKLDVGRLSLRIQKLQSLDAENSSK